MLCINYRPISIISIYSKIFEKLIYSRMYYFLNKNNLIYEKQFGFRAKHSVNHALISTTELIKDKLECGNFVAGIFIDLENAFDTVNHEILINKLAYYGFRGVTQNLLKSFLTNRKQYVSVNGFDSEKLDVLWSSSRINFRSSFISDLYKRPEVFTQILCCKSLCWRYMYDSSKQKT